MFYVIYATPEGFISTVHCGEWKQAETFYEMLSAPGTTYSYIQLGMVGAGLISDKYNKLDKNWGSDTNQFEIDLGDHKPQADAVVATPAERAKLATGK